MKNLISLLILCTGLGSHASGQAHSYSGHTIDIDSGKPVPYVLVLASTDKILTTTDSTGFFTFTTPTLYDSVTFTTIGYKDLTLSLNSLSDRDTIALTEEPIFLSEIIIGPEYLNTDILGTKELPENLLPYIFGNVDNVKIATHYKLKNRPVKIEKASIYISENPGGTFKLLCKILEFDKGYPGNKILKHEVVVASATNSGWVDFDFSESEEWIYQKNILLSVEVDTDCSNSTGQSEKSYPGFAYLPNGGNTYLSFGNQDTWIREEHQIITKMKIAYYKDK